MANLSKVVDQFKKLSFSQKDVIFRVLCEKVEGDNDGQTINRLEKSLTRVLVKRFEKRSTRGINSALKTFSKTDSLFTKKDGNKVIKALEIAYKNIEVGTSSRVKSDIKEIYILNKKRFAKRFGLSTIEKKLYYQKPVYNKVCKQVGEIKVEIKSCKWQHLNKKYADHALIKVADFSDADEKIYANLAALENIAIGDHFPKTLKRNVSSLIQKGVLEKGLNKKQAGEFLRKELTRRLGGKVSAVPPSIAKQGLNATTAYYEGLNATHVTFARNFGQLQMMQEAGIEKYIWDSIIDNRTSMICAQMNGRIFTVESSLSIMNKVVGADDVETLHNVAPFKRNLSEFGLKEGKKLSNANASASLQKAGVGLPPIHFRCRSEINPF